MQRATLTIAAFLLLTTAADARDAWYEGFEQSRTSWEVDSMDVRFTVHQHQRVRGEAYTGEGCERLRISAGKGTFVFFRHFVGSPWVTDELIPSLRVKSDRPGLQLVARVVLPRTNDPSTGLPLRILVRGSSYSTIGRWQQLRLVDCPERLRQQVRVIRSHESPDIDVREAYIEHLILNVYGGPGETNVWIDDLDIADYVHFVPRSFVRTVADWRSPNESNVLTEAPPVRVEKSHPRSKLVGSVLLVDGRPLFVRAIAYRGEPIAWLKRLGFNAIWFEQPPSLRLLEEVRSLGLWSVCPPPVENRSIHSAYDPVLAWDMGSNLTKEDLPTFRDRVEQLHLADRDSDRPLICHPREAFRAFSRHCDLLVVGRAPLGTTLELTDFGKWIRRSPRFARPGTPIWTTVQTQHDPTVAMQWQRMGIGPTAPTTVTCEQARLAVYTAVTSGSRGLLFESHSRLDANDPDTLHRAMTLELLNLELLLFEPWLASGSFETTVTGSQPEVIGAVLRTERSRLLVPIFSAPGAQFVPGQSAASSISFIVPGVPVSHNAYLLSPGGLQPLRHQRVTGGTRVILDEFSLTSLVVFSQDPLIVTHLSNQAGPIVRRAAELQRKLAAGMLGSVRKVDRELKRAYARIGVQDVNSRKSAEQLDAAGRSLQWCEGMLAAKDDASAYLQAERAMRLLRLVKRAHWLKAVDALPSPVTSPAAVSFRTLPWHWSLIDRIGTDSIGPNRLPGGDFENLGPMLESGWTHYRSEQAVEGIQSGADLIPQAARSGQLGLRLYAQQESNEESAGRNLIESPPAWMKSPEIPVKEGQIALVHGWVQIPKPITGSIDGLMIFDSLGGPALADRIGETTGWQEFLLYRIAPESGTMTIRFALTGLGEVWIDNVTVRLTQSTTPLTSNDYRTIPPTGFVPCP